jgi:hypothetical protein
MTETKQLPLADKDELLRALKTAVSDFVVLVRGVSDPSALAVGHWSIRDVAAHVTDIFEHYKGVAEGKGSVAGSMDEITSYNAARVAAIADTDLDVLADRLDAASRPYLETLSAIEGDPIVPWTEIQIPISTVIGLGLSELLVHGHDVASAEKRPWRLDPHQVALSLRAISPVTVHYLDAEKAGDLRACFDLRLRGQTRFFFIIEDGKMSIEEPSTRPVDVHISADPAAFMLVGYGRISQWGPVAKGQLMTWGRKPWLALKFATLLKSP